MNRYNISDFYSLSNSEIDKKLWQFCFEDNNYLKIIMGLWFSWQGGTIHQVITEVKKNKHNQK